MVKVIMMCVRWPLAVSYLDKETKSTGMSFTYKQKKIDSQPILKTIHTCMLIRNKMCVCGLAKTLSTDKSLPTTTVLTPTNEERYETII
uniref:CSON000005 protein n=1 Tax=Culicoides sonorensis TaxID=179676 RepID=A0A336KV39_CULSO